MQEAINPAARVVAVARAVQGRDQAGAVVLFVKGLREGQRAEAAERQVLLGHVPIGIVRVGMPRKAIIGRGQFTDGVVTVLQLRAITGSLWAPRGNRQKPRRSNASHAFCLVC